MANALPPFPSFDLRATDANNIGLEWTKWVERFQNFLVACNITSDTRKKALLLHYVGEEVYDLFQSLPASTLETTSEYEAAKAKLDAHFAPRINPPFALYRFRQTKQNVGESLDAFYARLRQLARHYGFADADLEIKSQIILATSSSRLRKYVMLHSLNLPDLLKQGRMFEDVERDVYEIEKNDGNAAVLAVHKDGQHGHHQRDGRRPPRKSHERQRPRVSSRQRPRQVSDLGKSATSANGKSATSASQRTSATSASGLIKKLRHQNLSSHTSIPVVATPPGTESVLATLTTV
ncbi:hypothetical protein MTO96_030329 [Rhipicephalus appendiculatus]